MVTITGIVVVVLTKLVAVVVDEVTAEPDVELVGTGEDVVEVLDVMLDEGDEVPEVGELVTVVDEVGELVAEAEEVGELVSEAEEVGELVAVVGVPLVSEIDEAVVGTALDVTDVSVGVIGTPLVVDASVVVTVASLVVGAIVVASVVGITSLVRVSAVVRITSLVKISVDVIGGTSLVVAISVGINSVLVWAGAPSTPQKRNAATNEISCVFMIIVLNV